MVRASWAECSDGFFSKTKKVSRRPYEAPISRHSR